MRVQREENCYRFTRLKPNRSLSVLVISSQISLCDFALCSHECLSEFGGVEDFESGGSTMSLLRRVFDLGCSVEKAFVKSLYESRFASFAFGWFAVMQLNCYILII